MWHPSSGGGVASWAQKDLARRVSKVADGQSPARLSNSGLTLVEVVEPQFPSKDAAGLC